MHENASSNSAYEIVRANSVINPPSRTVSIRLVSGIISVKSCQCNHISEGIPEWPSKLCCLLAGLSAEELIFRLINFCGQIVIAASIGVTLLNQRSVRRNNILLGRIIL